MRTRAGVTLLALLGLLLIDGCSLSITPAPPVTAVPSPTSGTTEPSAVSGPTQPPLTPIDELGITGRPIDVNVESYRLVVDGLVERPLSLSLEDLTAYPAVTQVPRLECPGFFVDYAEWSGPLVRTILEDAGVKTEATEVVFYDGSEFPYRRKLTLEEALRDDTFLAYELYGQPLPPEHGFPLRLVAGSKLGSSWVKWLFRIEVK